MMVLSVAGGMHAPCLAPSINPKTTIPALHHLLMGTVSMKGRFVARERRENV
jgi:hypothetical protein